MGGLANPLASQPIPGALSLTLPRPALPEVTHAAQPPGGEELVIRAPPLGPVRRVDPRRVIPPQSALAALRGVERVLNRQNPGGVGGTCRSPGVGPGEVEAPAAHCEAPEGSREVLAVDSVVRAHSGVGTRGDEPVPPRAFTGARRNPRASPSSAKLDGLIRGPVPRRGREAPALSLGPPPNQFRAGVDITGAHLLGPAGPAPLSPTKAPLRVYARHIGDPRGNEGARDHPRSVGIERVHRDSGHPEKKGEIGRAHV